jgi:uncharacterized protein (TIGR03437 family)
MGLVRVCLGLAAVAGILMGQAPALTNIAGRGERGFDGDGGAAVSAAVALANLQTICDPKVSFEQTSHIAVDTKGNTYFTDSNNQRIRRIDSAGVITTVAGNGAVPPANARCEPTGPVNDGPNALAAQLFNPSDVIVNPANGNLIVADQQNNRIRQITPAGAISTIVGNGQHNFYAPGVLATASAMDWPSALALDPTGALYFAELHTNRIGKLGTDGRLSTVAGSGFPGFSGDSGPAGLATLTKPAGIAIDRTGAVLIADTGNHRIRRVADGIITTIAGTGAASFCGDGGPATQACLNTPMDVKADTLGNIYIADTVNNRIRRIDSAGIITTVATDLNLPCAIAIDANNDLLIVDWQNYRIRKLSFAKAPLISPGGVVNGASFQSPVAPGAIISIFGQGFGDGAGASVTVNGVNAPVSLVMSTQINAQMPYGIGAGEATAVITTAAGSSAPLPFSVSDSAPGIFTYGTGRAICTNEDGTLNAPDNSVAHGQALVCYVTGLGAVTPEVQTGQSAPADHITSAVAPVSATVGGAQAQVFFAGLSTGFIGLGQVNLFVPDGAPTGDVPLVIQGSPAATVSVR